MTGPAISTACPPALGRVRGPAPVDSPWKSLRAPARGESRSASSGRSAPSCYSAGHPTGPNKHHRGSPNTEFLTPPTDLARSQCQSLRLRLLRIGAVVTRSTRTVAVRLSTAYPDQAVFRLLVQRLTAG